MVPAVDAAKRNKMNFTIGRDSQGCSLAFVDQSSSFCFSDSTLTLQERLVSDSAWAAQVKFAFLGV
jgi:hypothetical protein